MVVSPGRHSFGGIAELTYATLPPNNAQCAESFRYAPRFDSQTITRLQSKITEAHEDEKIYISVGARNADLMVRDGSLEGRSPSIFLDIIVTKAENCLMGGISWEEQQIRDLALTPCLLVVNLMAYSVTSTGPRKQLADFDVEETLSLSKLSERQSLFRLMESDSTRPSTQYHRGRNLILGSCDSYLFSTGSPETSAKGTDLSLSLTSSLDVSASQSAFVKDQESFLHIHPVAALEWTLVDLFFCLPYPAEAANHRCQMVDWVWMFVSSSKWPLCVFFIAVHCLDSFLCSLPDLSNLCMSSAALGALVLAAAIELRVTEQTGEYLADFLDEGAEAVREQQIRILMSLPHGMVNGRTPTEMCFHFLYRMKMSSILLNIEVEATAEENHSSDDVWRHRVRLMAAGEAERFYKFALSRRASDVGLWLPEKPDISVLEVIVQMTLFLCGVCFRNGVHINIPGSRITAVMLLAVVLGVDSLVSDANGFQPPPDLTSTDIPDAGNLLDALTRHSDSTRTAHSERRASLFSFTAARSAASTPARFPTGSGRSHMEDSFASLSSDFASLSSDFSAFDKSTPVDVRSERMSSFATSVNSSRMQSDASECLFSDFHALSHFCAVIFQMDWGSCLCPILLKALPVVHKCLQEESPSAWEFEDDLSPLWEKMLALRLPYAAEGRFCEVREGQVPY